MEFLSDFNFQIKYIVDKSNQKADTLMRQEKDCNMKSRIQVGTYYT